MTTTEPLLSSAQLVELFKLIQGADSVELKLTIPERSDRSVVRALEMDPLDAQIRQVFFFDTPSLDLNQAGVVARARRVQGKGGDSVVKLRPVVPDALPASVRNAPNLGVEVDAMPGGFVCSASYKGKTGLHDAREVAAGQRKIKKLFSKEQRDFFTAHAPEGLTFDDLKVLGPIFVLKLKYVPSEYGRPLVGELWLYPDNSRILELSTKCLPNEAFDVAANTRAYLESHGIETTGEQHTKTKTALEFFANELRASSERSERN
jgi:hypothetical protein